MVDLTRVILRPLISEKATVQTENFNRYGFVVTPKATKFQIRLAVEKLYNVKVLNVKTAINPGKVKRRGMTSKKTSQFKKAFVQLGEGQKIEFFKGI